MPAPAPLYLDTVESVDRFLAELSDVRDIALDTEGASFHKFVDRIYLLQLSTAQHEAVIDPLPIGTPERLGTLLEDRAVEVVLHDADYDLRLLHQDYGWRVTHLFDTRVAAQLLGIRAFGLAALLEQFFGLKLDKKHQRADWSMRPLTADMLDYAAQDTRHLLGLRDRLRAELEKKGRMHWAQEEFQRAEGTQWDVELPDTSFLRLKGARDLTRRELARLRELVRWRDGIAAELDRATFRVAGNEVLFDLSRAAPLTREGLFAVKGFPRGMSEARVAEAIAAIGRGNLVPDADLPRFAKSVRWDRDPDFDDRVARLKSFRDTAAVKLDLDPGVLCSRDRMEAVARRSPTTLDELLEVTELRRWQAEVLGEGFVRALASGGTPAGTPAGVPAKSGLSSSVSAPIPPTAKAPAKAPVAKSLDDSPYKSEV
ncbi:MAG TPA: HRDC domain-containing protein [Gemmatimonas sp.]|nr:HRDC domain-containing protein [Gemmatimonas sp.]